MIMISKNQSQRLHLEFACDPRGWVAVIYDPKYSCDLLLNEDEWIQLLGYIFDNENWQLRDNRLYESINLSENVKLYCEMIGII